MSYAKMQKYRRLTERERYEAQRKKRRSAMEQWEIDQLRLDDFPVKSVIESIVICKAMAQMG